MICIGASLSQATESRLLAKEYPFFVYYSAGIHPHDAAVFSPVRDLPLLREYFQETGNNNPGGGTETGSKSDAIPISAVAVGECGLDYHYDHSPRDVQRRVFSAQLALAAEFDKPVIVHSREAEADTISMVSEAGKEGIRGVLHCFTGSPQLAAAAIEADWYISFSGIVTFKKWERDDVVRSVPSDRILVESDAPYLAPVPFRGKRNEPAWVLNTLHQVAKVRGVEVEALAPLVIENTKRLFSLYAD